MRLELTLCRSACAFALATALNVQPVLGQTLRGQIIDSSTGSALTGVLVEIRDAQTAIVARLRTDRAGRFTALLSQPGAYTAVALRIGFAPVTSATMQLGLRDDAHVTLKLHNERLALDTIQVQSRATCSREAAPDPAALMAWEQARTALRLSAMTQTEGVLATNALRYQRVLDALTGRVLEHRTTSRSGTVGPPWITLPMDEVRTDGYVRRQADGSFLFHAPDVSHLASEAFVAAHCFRILPSSTGDIQVAFEPSANAAASGELRGTLRLDRQSLALRSLDFMYTGVPDEIPREQASGRLEFLQLEDGSWLIARWRLRLPVMRQRVVRNLRTTEVRREVVALSEVGGELSTVTLKSDTVWVRDGLTMNGRILGPAGREAWVRLAGTLWTARANPDGRFRIPNMAYGSYAADFGAADADVTGIWARVPLAFTDTAEALTIDGNRLDSVARATCPTQDQGVIIAGRARFRHDTVPQRNARVTAAWFGPTGTFAGSRHVWVEATIDSRGHFRVCGAPTAARVVLRGYIGGYASYQLLQTPASPTVVASDLVLAPAPTGTIGGRVISTRDGTPLSGAEVSLPGAALTTVTDSAGRFQIFDVPSGVQVLRGRLLGHRLTEVSVEVASGNHTQQDLALAWIPQMDTITAVASRGIGSFDEHRRLGLGHFLTRDDLKRAEGLRLSHALSQLPGLHIQNGRANSAYIAGGRGKTSITGKCRDRESFEGSGPSANCACFAQVYVDDMLVFAGGEFDVVPDINRFLPESVEAVEFYSGAAQTPAKYSRLNSNCGVLVIHTRRPH
jgi:hypothetical protein